jgi:predicted  nucleic acid-binding Zn-ribbon protein
VAEVATERELRGEIDRLRRDIEQVRDELGETLVALEDRASPKRIAERKKEQARERIASARDSAGAVVQSVDRRVLVGGAAVLAALLLLRVLRH